MNVGSAIFTVVHVALSWIGVGMVVLYGAAHDERGRAMEALFLFTTLATVVTGFLFPFEQFLPSHVIGLVSLVLLAVAIPGATSST